MDMSLSFDAIIICARMVCSRRARAGGGEVFGPHESLDDAQLAIVAYVDDGSGHFHILAAEHRTVVNRR